MKRILLVLASLLIVANPSWAEEPAPWRLDPRAQRTIYSGPPARVRICVTNQSIGVRWGGNRQTIIDAKSCADITAENIELNAGGAPVAVEGTYVIISP